MGKDRTVHELLTQVWGRFFKGFSVVGSYRRKCYRDCRRLLPSLPHRREPRVLITSVLIIRVLIIRALFQFSFKQSPPEQAGRNVFGEGLDCRLRGKDDERKAVIARPVIYCSVIYF